MPPPFFQSTQVGSEPRDENGEACLYTAGRLQPFAVLNPSNHCFRLNRLPVRHAMTHRDGQMESLMSPTPTTAPITSWFALRVRSRSEIMVRILLEAKGYQSYVPSHTSERQYSDRLKRAEVALFPGYVFCR